MKPSVRLIKGLYITAADKRNILAAIDFLEDKFSVFVEVSPQTAPNYADIVVKRRGSPKSYAISPRPSARGTYDVVILETSKNDYGVERSYKTSVTVRVMHREPLYLPNYTQPGTSPNLFSDEEGAIQ